MTDESHDTGGTALWTRGRLLASRNARTLIAVGVVLVLAGAWVSFGVVTATDTTETRTTVDGELRAAFDHEATVTESTELHPAGTTLEDEPIYFAAASPTLEGTVTLDVTGPATTDADVTTAVTLRYAAVEDGTVYWEERVPLAETTERGVPPGQTVTVPVSVNVSAIGERIDAIESDLGASPGETEIVLEVDHAVAGPRGEWTLEQPVVIEATDATFTVTGDDPTSETIESEETVQVAASPPLYRIGAGPVLLVAGLGTLLWSRRLGRLPAAERALLAHRVDRERYDDVIVTAALPPSVVTGDLARVASLGDLARIAIDLESVVVYDPERDRYAVPVGEVTYTVEPPAREEEREPTTITFPTDGEPVDPPAQP